ncbi:superoxide dismutase [Blattabacterium cuenoti]|uniref:superoxide dismutase n=1 Tax=Blattabacterium cuenoti TaxID=1653831 RepID=UPI00163CC541|nr:superoxide dismutase [Blattabacterium cuenoti]
MSFKKSDLLYSYEDLEPFIDRDTMNIHYNKHHTSYTDNLNQYISGTDMENLSIEEILRRSHIENPSVRNNSGGFFNHNFFWKILIPHSKFSNPSIYWNNILKNNFNSFNLFKEQFTNAAMSIFGSGWTWLCVKDKKLCICTTPNQDNPIMYKSGCEGNPILGLDLWEHAYYLKYQNKRLDYISSFWKIINWKNVEKNYQQAIGYL